VFRVNPKRATIPEYECKGGLILLLKASLKHFFDFLFAEWRIIRIVDDKFFNGALSLLIRTLTSR